MEMATATLELDGDYCELEIPDRIPTESIPIMDDFDYPSNIPNPTTTTSSESFIKSLEIVKITIPDILKKLLQTSSCCSICTDDFAVDDNLTQLPYCWHWFHHDCILPWLQRNNTCPLCRHELFHDDHDKMEFDIEEVEIEDILMEMLEEGLNERDNIRQLMETDSSEELQHQQAIDILSELFDESRDNNTGQNQQLWSNLSESVD